MSEHEIAMQLTLKAMELNFIGSQANEETENTKIISDFYKAMYKTYIVLDVKKLNQNHSLCKCG